MKKKISAIITDVDNTLYDWVEMWYASFNAMLQMLVKQSEIPQERVEAEIQQVFQRHGTSEYRFLIQELPSLREKHPKGHLDSIYKDAIAAYRIAREEALRLYPSVLDTMITLKNSGCLIIACTESMRCYTVNRIKRLGLDGVLHYIYSPEDHDLPQTITDSNHAYWFPEEHYRLYNTEYRPLTKGVRKPNSEILRKILDDFAIQPENAIYVGDNLMKDVLMAQDAHVTDVHAAYGVAQHTQAYELLRKVTHWRPTEVERERDIYKQRTVTPTHVLHSSFSEVLTFFDFVQSASRSNGV